jgi:hypothetical protein
MEDHGEPVLEDNEEGVWQPDTHAYKKLKTSESVYGKKSTSTILLKPLEQDAPLLEADLGILSIGESMLYNHVTKDTPDGHDQKSGMSYWYSGMTIAQLRSFLTSLSTGYLVPCQGATMPELVAIADLQGMKMSPCPFLEKNVFDFSINKAERVSLIKQNIDLVALAIATWPKLHVAMENAAVVTGFGAKQCRRREPFLGCSPGNAMIVFGPMSSLMGATASGERNGPASVLFQMTNNELKECHEKWPDVISSCVAAFGRMHRRVCKEQNVLTWAEGWTQKLFCDTVYAIERLNRGFTWTAYVDDPSNDEEFMAGHQFARCVRAYLVPEPTHAVPVTEENGGAFNFCIPGSAAMKQQRHRFSKATVNFVYNMLYKQSIEMAHIFAPPPMHKNGSTLCRRMFDESMRRHGMKVQEWTTMDTLIHCIGDCQNCEMLNFPPHHGTLRPGNGLAVWTPSGMPVPIVSLEMIVDDTGDGTGC